MNTIDKVIGVSFTLIMAYLIIKNADAFNTVVGSIGNNVSTIDKTLQGR